MKDLDSILNIISENITSLKKNFKIREIGVFGSYARNDQDNNSDIDILIDYDRRYNFSLIDLIRLEDYLTNLLGRKVDLALKKTLKPVIGSHILKEVIYL